MNFGTLHNFLGLLFTGPNGASLIRVTLPFAGKSRCLAVGHTLNLGFTGLFSEVVGYEQHLPRASSPLPDAVMQHSSMESETAV